ncbi:hypothetical protein Drorol1_Dr00014982 [Drosera rotundifolia]
MVFEPLIGDEVRMSTEEIEAALVKGDDENAKSHVDLLKSSNRYIKIPKGQGSYLKTHDTSQFNLSCMRYPLYKKVKPRESQLIRLVQVVVAATKKKRARFPEDPSFLYSNKVLDADISTDGRLVHTEQWATHQIPLSFELLEFVLTLVVLSCLNSGYMHAIL